MKEEKSDIIVSLGGSVIFPDTGINNQFLKEFELIVREKIAKKNWRFFIFAGGGHVAREYQYTAERVIGKVKDEDIDWLGIHATRLNAHLLRTIFRDLALPRVLVKYDRLPALANFKIVICAGSKPGATTDFDVVKLANLLKVKEVFSFLNVAGIYDRDPKIFQNARLLKHLNWSAYQEMIGDWWQPKRQVPFDPFATKLAQKIGLRVYFLDGKNAANLKDVLEKKDFVGSIID